VHIGLNQKWYDVSGTGGFEAAEEDSEQGTVIYHLK
jgi:hypothetical protein